MTSREVWDHTLTIDEVLVDPNDNKKPLLKDKFTASFFECCDLYLVVLLLDRNTCVTDAYNREFLFL